MTVEDCKRCRFCLYYGKRSRSCDYMLISRQRRGEPVSPTCSRYESRAEVRKLSRYFAGLGGMRPSDEVLIKLYGEGHTDKEIADALGKSRALVAHWRRKFCLPSSRELEVEISDG